MKKILIALLVLICSFSAFSQTPIGLDSFFIQTLGNSKTIIRSKGAITSDSGFVNSVYADTSVANLGRIKNYPGAQIRVADGIWVRNNDATKWQLVSLDAGTFSADTNFIRNQYAYKETKNSFYDTSQFLRLRPYNTTLVIDATSPAGITIHNTHAPTSAAFPLSLAAIANVRATFESGFTGGSGTGAGMSLNLFDSFNNRSFTANSLYFGNHLGAWIVGNVFYPSAITHGLMGYRDAYMTNRAGTDVIDFTTSGTSTFSDSSIRIPNVPDYVSGSKSVIVRNNGTGRIELCDTCGSSGGGGPGGGNGIGAVYSDWGLLNVNDSTLAADSAVLSSYYLRHVDSTDGGYYPYTSNPKGYLTGISTFNANTDAILNDISGPVLGDSSYTPDLSGNDFLIGKDLYLLIRNNIPAIRGTDYLFNSITGTIYFTQPANDDENFMFYYTAGNSSTISDTVAVINDTSTFTTNFGIMIAGTDLNVSQKISLSDSFNVDYIRTSIILTKWDGSDNYLDAIQSAGKKAILNINWKSVEKDALGNKIPNAYVQPSEYTQYDALLDEVLTKYGSCIEVVVIENEPTNDSYFSGPISDYIALLAEATTIVHAHSLLITDGCIHVELVQKVIAGGSLSANAQQVADIIAAYPSLSLDFTNIHTHGPNQPTYTIDLKSVCDYIRANNGGKPVMCNEYHLDASYPSLIESLVAKMKEANVIYSVPFDAGSQTGGGVTFHVIGSVLLNTLGTAYKIAIQ